jgi:flotillin
MVLVFALALIAAPIALPIAGIKLAGAASALLTGSGVILALGSSALLIIARLYHKTGADEAFVRTGMGGMKVIKDGGALVIPTVHRTIQVPLESFRLEMARQGTEGLITGDKLRADIHAEFYVRVMPTDEDIMNAARSLGDRMQHPEDVRKLVEDKLVSALRNVAAKRTLEQLNSDRDTFVQEVVKIVTSDLKHNGLTLESVTISKLDQTDPTMLKENNIFDAQGLRTIAEITQEQLTRRNALERQGEQERTEQDVRTRQQILELDRARAEAESAQQAEVAKFTAARQREAQEKQIEAQREIELANVERAKAVEVATRDMQRATDVAERQKLEAIKRAEEAMEVAERKKQEAVARAEAERAAAEAELARAEAEREKARQAIQTVEIQAQAEREKQRQITLAQAEAERKLLSEQRQADANAYRVQREAEARKAAADAEAEAIMKKAQAEAEAAKRKADGDKAVAMVPVEVKKAEVDVEQRRVEVLQKELEARAQHGEAAQQYELAKLRIMREAEVRIESARAVATLLGKVEATVVGTPEDVARMTQGYMNGLGLARTLDGFLGGASDELKGATASIGSRLGELAGALTQRLEGAAEAIPVTVEAPVTASVQASNGKPHGATPARR